MIVIIKDMTAKLFFLLFNIIALPTTPHTTSLFL